MRQQNTTDEVVHSRKLSISTHDIRVERDVIRRQQPGPVKNDWPTTDGPKPQCDDND